MTPHDDQPAAPVPTQHQKEALIMAARSPGYNKNYYVSAQEFAAFDVGYAAAQASAPQVPREQAARILALFAGYASMCWEPKPTGIFASERCSQAVDDALSKLYAAPPAASARGDKWGGLCDDCPDHSFQKHISGQLRGPVKCGTCGTVIDATTPVPAPAAAVAEPVKCVEKDCSEPSCMPNSEYCEFHARLEAGKGLLRDLGDPAIGGLTIAEMQRAHATPEPAPAATGDELVRRLRERMHTVLLKLRMEAADRIEADAARIELADQVIAFADMVRLATHPSPASWAHYDQKRAFLAQADAKGSKGAG